MPVEREVWIRRRPDGVTELSRKVAPLDVEDRWLVITTVMITTWGLFVAGGMPVSVLATVTASCLVGELVLGAKAIVLALLRPLARVHELSPRRDRAG